MKPFIIQTTYFSKKDAQKLANILLDKRLAACIQISKIRSFYTWENQLCEDKEYLVTIKTEKNNYKKIKRKIKENHSYDVPEIIGLELKKTSKDYKKFIKDSTK